MSHEDFEWLNPTLFLRIDQVREDLHAIWTCGATPDLLQSLQTRLAGEFEKLLDRDSAVSNLSRFIQASRSPIALLSLFERDEDALPSLLKFFATSQTLANRLIVDPESFDLLRESDGQPALRKYLVDEALGLVANIEAPSRAGMVLQKFVNREVIRIAYGEFVRDLSPDGVGHQLAYVADAVIEAALTFATKNLIARRGQPMLVSGAVPQVAIFGLGNLGGEELGYGAPLELVFLYDTIDSKNPSHREFYDSLAESVVSLLTTPDSGAFGIEVDLSMGKTINDSTASPLINSASRTATTLEKKGHTWQRMAFAKARLVAGSAELGETFLQRIRPWVFHRVMSRNDLVDIRTLRMKLERRADSETQATQDVLTNAGGRQDIELTVQFLQLLHGGDLPDVRLQNCAAAIDMFQRTGCLTTQEATLLAGNYARLCRLQHQLSVMFGKHLGEVPSDPAMLKQLAWQLGIRTSDGNNGDLERFDQQLAETFAVNRKMINHLMVDIPTDSSSGQVDDITAAETELILDPSPEVELVEKTLSRHGLTDPMRSLDDLLHLSTESVSFLSPQRCRHFLAAIAPALLEEIGKTPFPDKTLHSLVEVADSIGAKASLWELLGANRPTMQLMVRLCASAPYLSGILVSNPGMIDELIDCLLMNRLPSSDRLDAQSMELCRGAADIDLILHSFKNSAHLMIGVRDMLGMEMVESTQASLSDTAEAVLRRVIEHEQEQLASQFGDPIDEDGEPAEMLAVALGKFGGREPNYHSDLDVIFLYTGVGETKRRVGGRRSTTTNQLFFNQLAQRVIARINNPGPNGRLYELDGRLRPAGNEGLLAVSVDDFLRRFRQDIAPLWQRLALCRARAISGSRRNRKRTNQLIADVISETRWHGNIVPEVLEMRSSMEETATPQNLKRGPGGTVDVEVIAQMLTLKHAGDTPEILATGTTQSLLELSLAGYLPEVQALTLVQGYRTLRRVEAYLRLMNTSARHELPSDPAALKNLAFLMKEADPAMILTQCEQARKTNRQIFEQILGGTMSQSQS